MGQLTTGSPLKPQNTDAPEIPQTGRGTQRGHKIKPGAGVGAATVRHLFL